MKLRSIDFFGRIRGRVRDLSGFRKGVHRVPDSVSERTREFVARIAAADLEEEANTLRERLKKNFGYKRKELTYACEGASALLSTRDFDLALSYAQDDEDRQSYVVSYQLTNIKNPETLRDAGLQAILFRNFDEVRLTLDASYRIEDLIDTVEEEEPENVELEYPEDCSQLTILIAGRNWYLRFMPHGAAIFSRSPGSPLQMINHVQECQEWVRETPALGALLEGAKPAN
ncbi:hypothetical protein H5P28_01550 [Ruficoccus amylovorans]|uniref:Uncharacterized protein n=1 Tax=Ruficoccus amylovorans TaxID=1804625 RepID=A0A842H9J0_9BACT|nr:hypothetical protein [Ruficoccus amylovorans]MBC2592935.1 hypothetical protein [Ruficoccus amylovorans]